MEAQNAQPFSLECTKVKFPILDNFDFYNWMVVFTAIIKMF